MTRSVLLLVTAATVAYCGSQPSAASDSMRDATRHVATRPATDGGERAGESGSTPPSRGFVSANDASERLEAITPIANGVPVQSS